jgi:PTH1 family peptidyl-tRNA hydrolase
MFLIAGLGNPEEKYFKTRHNFGFRVIDALAEKYKIDNHQKKFNADLNKGKIGEEEVVLVKPLTYMNRSGISIKDVKAFYKVAFDKIIVIHDDIDLALGKIKIKTGGGDGGHNGLKSIDENIGKNYMRIRLGIGRPKDDGDSADFVLKKFNSDEKKIVEGVVGTIVDDFPQILAGERERFLNRFYLK